MNSRKIIISLVLITILTLVQFASIVYAEEDMNPPNIISISLNNHNVQVGETLTFNVEIEDDYSGANILYIQWNLESDNTKSISKQFNNVADLENFNYTIPENTYAGIWKTSYISLSDYANHHVNFARDDTNEELLSKLDFEIADTNQDIEAPVVSNVRIITQDFSAPGEVIIQYDVIDDKSGVKSNYGGVSYTQTGCGLSFVSDNTYQSTLYMESQYLKYTFEYIQVSDNAGNWKNYTYQDLGLTNELDITPSNYKKDSKAPTLLSIDYNKTTLNIPDSLYVTFDIEENESGFSGSLGKAYFKSENGEFNKELYIDPATNSNGMVINNKGVVRIDFDPSETFVGNIFLYKVILEDQAKNSKTYLVNKNDFEKKEISITKNVKEYTLETSTAKENYISEIRDLSDGSTVLCNVAINNQIIKKELFDAIKGKNITITFITLYNGSSSSEGGSVSSSDSNMGIQWIINGKDIVNETKDIDMTINLSKRIYSKILLPEYQFSEIEQEYWKNADWENSSEEELLDGIHKLQKVEIEKYFNYLKEQGYLNTDQYLQNTLEQLPFVDAVVRDIILMSNEYTDYLSIEFADNGLLPGKALIRIKPEYATRVVFGAKDLKLYYVDGNNISLVDSKVSFDDEDYYNFYITHNSEYWLTNENIETLEKIDTTTEDKIDANISDMNTNENEFSNNPQTGDDLVIWIEIMVISIFGMIYLTKNKINNK